MNLTDPLFLAEVFAALSSIAYSLLLMREKISGWAFGIISSMLSMVVFYHTKLYAQSLISIYYVGIGIYGWIYWNRARSRNEHIHRWKINQHIIYSIIFTIFSFIGYYFFSRYTDASRPLLDSFLTSFGILASIKEARKILSSWTYWFVINLFSALLYYSQDLNVYAILMVVYAGICIPGYLNWKRIFDSHPLQEGT